MMDHPKDEILIDYLLDELTEVETRAIREHVESCDQCSERVRKLMRVMNTLDEIPNVETDGRIAERVLEELELSDIPLIKVLPPDELKKVVKRRRPLLAGFAAAAILLFASYLIQIYSPPGVFADKGVLNARLEVPSKVTPNAAVPVSLSIWDEAKEMKTSEGNYDVEFKLASKDQSTLIDKASVSMEETSRRFVNLSGIKPGEYQLQAWSDGKQLVSTLLEINPSYEISVKPDRPIYKPSDSINMRISAREVGGKAASEKDVALVIRDPMDNLVKQETKKLDDFGTVGFEYPIADIAPLGEYLVVARVENSETEQKIIVDDYTMPRFSVDLQPERNFMLLPGTYKATVKANYFFGKPLVDSDVLVEWYVPAAFYEIKKYFSINGTTNDFGEFQFAMNPVDQFPRIHQRKHGTEISYFRIIVSDKTGRQEELVKAVKMSGSPILIRTYSENGNLNPGLVNKIYIYTTYPDGTPAVADLQIKINDKTVSGKTSSLGIFTLNFKVDTKDVFLKITAVVDGYDSSSFEFSYGKSGFDIPFILRPMKSVFKSDEQIQLEMTVPFSVPMTAHLDLFKSDHWIESKDVEIKDSVTSVEWLSGGVTGELTVEASLNYENRVFARDRTTFIISESDKLKVGIKTDSATYKPGEMIKANVDISANEQPAQASLGVTASDKSLAKAGEKAEMSSRMISSMIQAGLEDEFVKKFDLASNDEINEFGLAAAISSEMDPFKKKSNSIGYRISPEESSLRSYEFSVASNYPLVALRFVLVGMLYLSIIFAMISALANVHRGTFGKLPLGRKALGTLKGFAVLAALASICFALTIYYPSIVILGLGLLITIGVVLRLSKCIGSDELIADSFSLAHIISATSILICSLLISHQGIWQPILRSLGRMHPFMSVSLLSILASIGCLVILTTMVIPERGGGKNAKTN